MSGLFKPGQLLRDGAIEIIDQLATGGVGEVYRVALQRNGQRVVMALKCFNPKHLEKSGLEAIEMVHRESSAVSKIQHPGVVTIHLIELEAQTPYIIEEYLPFGDLLQMIAERRRTRGEPSLPLFAASEIAQLGFQISSALMFLHQNNLYHGDLKPHNLCFRQKDPLEIVIVDFGHAGFLEGNILEQNENLATLAYLPPERTGFVKLAGNASSDLYSLGATLYECAVGLPPFNGQDGRDLINRLLYEVPKPLHEIFPDFPLALSDIISKLLRKDPSDRYHSAFGLAADLERCWLALRDQKELPPFALGTKDKLRELNYRIPMVGRQMEMTTLHELFDDAHEGGQSLALIGAPSGTGKSRLAFEILHKAKQSASLISYVKFSDYERNLPLSAVTLLLVEHCHYLKNISAEQLIAWQSKIKNAIGPRVQLIAERYAFYAPFLPVTESYRALNKDNGFQVFNQTLGEFLSLLPACGESQLLLIDDLQWADWQSLQVLAALGQKIINRDTPRTMLMGTYRSNEINEGHPLIPSFLEMQHQYTLIELGPLGRRDADTLVEHLLDEKTPEVEKLQDVCFRFTAGNPFFIYEYLKSAINTGLFALDGTTQTWSFHQDRIHEADLSSGVAGLVAERIRALSVVQQALVSIASVAGHAMKRSALKLLLPKLVEQRQLQSDQLGSNDVDVTIELSYQELLQKNILTPDLDRFAFFHDKVQEASYSLLDETERCLLHHNFGLLCMQELRQAAGKVNDSAIFEAAYHICRGHHTDLGVDIREFLVLAANAAKRVFAYEKAKEYLQTLLNAIDAQPDIGIEERFNALELMADILSISDQIGAAMEIYDKLLTFDIDPTKRAHIYAKKVEFCHNLFDYKNARQAAEAALELMGERVFTTEFWSYIYIVLSVPVLIVYCLWFKYFGRQTKQIQSEAEEIRFLLLCKNEISQYFTQPIVAIANIIPLTFELLKYKDNNYRATILCYWGIATSAFGSETFANRCYQQAYDYFDKTGNPVDKGFVLFAWGFTSDLPRGHLQLAQKKLEEAVFNLAPVGESFWRSISILGLVLLDYYGAETGQAGIRVHELVDLWKKVRYAATPLGTVLRHYLEDYNEEQAHFLLQKVQEADLHIQAQGYDSIDSVFACLSIGEYFDYLGQYDSAEVAAKRAFSISLTRGHRVAYALFPPIIYARVLIHQKKFWRALAVLSAAWANQLLRAHVFRPHTCYETGRWLYAMGWKRSGRFVVDYGLRYANKHHWMTPAAEGRLLLGQMIEHIDPDLSIAYIHLAKEYFQQRNWKFHENLCEKEMTRQKTARTDRSSSGTNRTAPRSNATQRGQGLRQQVEVQALMDVLLKLSAIKETEPLYRALMESLCQATGSELAILYFEEDGRWTPHMGHNIKIEPSELFKTKVDQSYIQKALQTRPMAPLIRKPQDQQLGRAATSGSALLLPLMSEGVVAGYCYLANTQLYDLFDKRGVEVAQPIATQGAIALANIRLNEELAVERDEIAKLHQTLELRVIEQTRDIKSIMAHIQMGICTVSGQSISINKDYSTFLEGMLDEAALRDKSLLPLLLNGTTLSADEIDQAKQALLSCLEEMEFAFDVNSHLLPRQLKGQGADGVPYAYELDWIPICDDNLKVEKVLVTINDVTELRGLEAIAARKDEELRIISEILGRSERDWSKFITGSKALLRKTQEQMDDLRQGEDPLKALQKIFMYVHTIKGNSRSLGLRGMNAVIHNIEQYFADCIRREAVDTDEAVMQEKLTAIEQVVRHYETIATQKLGRLATNTEAISVPRDPLLQIYEHLKFEDDGRLDDSMRLIRNSLFLSVQDLLQTLFHEVEPLAAELGKAPPEFHIEIPNLWVNRPTEELMRNCLVHLLRNSLDHGLQSPAERQSRGLKPQGTISVKARIRGRMIDFFVEDDGRGLNLKKLRDIGLQRSLLNYKSADDPKALAVLIFHPDLSTAERVSDLSGRGIGMTAVKDSLQDVGGSIDIQLQKNRRVDDGYSAFAFVITLPLDLFQSDSSQQAA